MNPGMPKLSRRQFLKRLGFTAAAGFLSACAPETLAPPPSTETPLPLDTASISAPSSTATLEPSATFTPSKTLPTTTATAAYTLVPEEMVLVEAGSFQMGSNEGYDDERPVHTVNITRPFYIGKCPVTYAQFTRFRNVKSVPEGGGNHPLARADWIDATEYCNWLSKKDALKSCYTNKGRTTRCDFTASGYRLPTEAEWEYAARGGQLSQGFTYAGSNDPDEVAWYMENSNGQVHPVGLKKPNELGLYDMSGNTPELVWDWYSEDYYRISPADDPTGPEKGEQKVRRGGIFGEAAFTIRVAFRSYDEINYPMNGFRLVRTEV